jgi:dTDP-4-amino-4,6-dideoxygalactose transaminase
MLFRPITISLSPNAQSDDVILAVKTLFTPWRWKEGKAEKNMQEWLANYFHSSHILLYNSGRSAQYEILKAFGIGMGDEVIIQAFTCVAVANSILWTGATPVYADIDESLNLTVESIEKRITKKTKAIIVQHTFGIPAKIDTIVALGKKYNLLIIEDCAHALGGSYKGKLLGTWGDAAFFSFGRDKVISSVFGGAALISDRKVFSKLAKQYEQLPYPHIGWILQQIVHPIACSVILPLYNIGIGKMLLVLLQKLHVLSFPVYKEEKKGKNPGLFPAKYPNALAILGLHQLKKLKRFTSIRKKAAEIYSGKKQHDVIYLRFPLLVASKDAALKKCKRRGILLGNWYQQAVDPAGVDFDSVGYTPGSCPVAEKTARHIINLPTLVSESHALTIAKMIQSQV